MHMYGGHVESKVMMAISELSADGGQVWIGCATPDTGGYGVLTLDPYAGIQLRLFGWDRLTPGSPNEHTPAIASLLRYTFVFDGVDWVWRRPFTMAMVPVVTHLVARMLIDAWNIQAGSADEELLDVQAIDPTSNDDRCNRCLRPECAGHS